MMRPRILPAIALILLLCRPALAGEFMARVTWVVDGDSVKLTRLDNREGEHCRMLGYNAPEMTGDESPLGQKALKHLLSMLKGQTVRVQGDKRDRYGRLLCDIWLQDGSHVNPLMRQWLAGELKYNGVGKYDHMNNR